MDKDYNLITNMNKILLNMNQKMINLPVLKQNIEYIYDLLDEPVPKNFPHKYNCLSCIFGAFLGDSIGSCCEFSPESPSNHLNIFRYEHGIFAPGEVTDDSEMAMSAAFAYIDSLNEKSKKVEDLIYYYFGVWRCSGPKDIGGATTNALRFWNGTQSIVETEFKNNFVKQVNWDSLANGFLMRISTFISYYYYMHNQTIYDTIQNFFKPDTPKEDLPDTIINLYLDILKESYKNVQITHPNYENGISSAVFTLMTLVGMVTKDAKKVYSIFCQISKSKKFIECHQDKAFKSYAEFVQKKYVQINNEITANQNFYVYNQMGYYMHGFKLCIYFLHKYPDMADNKDKDLYYKIMCEICDKGGDTDTNCAIVGAMIGPLIGYKNFKEKLFDKFIRFVPYNRCQFNSAFMYVYISYLEKKLLNNPTKMEKGEKTEIKNEEQKKIEDKKPELDEKKEEQNKESNNTENKKEDNKIEIKEENKGENIGENKVEDKAENKTENKAENKTENQPSQKTNDSENKDENKKFEEKGVKENQNIKPESEEKKEGFKYSAYKLILKFLNEEMDFEKMEL